MLVDKADIQANGGNAARYGGATPPVAVANGLGQFGTDAWAWAILGKLSPDNIAWLQTLPDANRQATFNAAKTITDPAAFDAWLSGLRVQAYYEAVNRSNASSNPTLGMPPPVQKPAPAAQAPAGGGGGGGGGGTAPVNIGPMGGYLVQMTGTYNFLLVFDVAPGVRITYAVSPNAPVHGVAPRVLGRDEFYAFQHNSVYAGDTQELTQMSKDYGTFQAFFNHMLDTVFVKNDPARNDPGMLAVIAQYAARPDMSPAELQNLLKSTAYAQSRTKAQAEWNDYSQAEQNSRIQDTLVQLGDEYFRMVGTQMDVGGYSDLARRVASGELSITAAVNKYFKPIAEQNPESPYMRTQRKELENQRQRGYDIEQKTLELRNLSMQWGVQMDDPTLAKWAQDMVELKMSDDDFLTALKTQAQILYPWKDPNMDTSTAAQPWIQTYGRVLEKAVDLSNNDLQQALQSGKTPAEFERELKNRPEWEKTRNFSESMQSALSGVGQKMGFS